MASFYGIGAAVIAIIARSAVKLLRGTVGQGLTTLGDLPRHGDYNRLETVGNRLALPVVRRHCDVGESAAIAGSARLPCCCRHHGDSSPACTGVATLGTLGLLFLFFVKAGAFVFGSGLAIVPFLYGGVVGKLSLVYRAPVCGRRCCRDDHARANRDYRSLHRISCRAASWEHRWLPWRSSLLRISSCCWERPTIAGSPTIPQVKAFVQGVTAAAVGAIAGAAYILARRSLIDVPTVLIAVITFAILTATKKIPEPVLILTAGVIGMVLRGTCDEPGHLPLMRYRTTGLFHLAWQVMFASYLLAQAAPPQPQTPDQNAARGEIRIVQATRVDRAPKLDGTLDDPLWQLATPISNFLAAGAL